MKTIEEDCWKKYNELWQLKMKLIKRQEIAKIHR